MATNAEPVVDDDKTVTEEDLRDLKYGSDEVETSEEEDESTEPEEDEEGTEDTGDEDGQTDDEATEDSEETDKTESDDEPTEYVKEFPNIKGDDLPEYARNLEKAYENSTTEALRLKGELDNLKRTGPADPDTAPDEPTISDPLTLYMKQKMDSEIDEAFTDFKKTYPQVNDPSEYDKFSREVAVFSQTIMSSQKRLASPAELYRKAAASLGWESDTKPSGKEKVGMALKSTAAVSKTSSGTGKAKPKSKVTEAMIQASKLMYPGKSDAEIREELEPHVQ